MIKTVIFDIGNVLVKFDWKTFVYGTFDKITADTVAEAIWLSGNWEEFDRGVLSDEEIIKRMEDAASEYKKEIHMTLDHAGEFLEKFSYTDAWIKSLKEQGYRVLYLSNYGEFVMGKNPEVLDFIPLMDGGVFSCYEKVIKPDPAIYAVLCERYELKPEECLFVDDNAANVKSAKELGFHAIQFEGYEKNYGEFETFLT